MEEEKAIWERVAENQEQTLKTYRAKMDEANVLYYATFKSQY